MLSNSSNAHLKWALAEMISASVYLFFVSVGVHAQKTDLPEPPQQLARLHM